MAQSVVGSGFVVVSLCVVAVGSGVGVVGSGVQVGWGVVVVGPGVVAGIAVVFVSEDGVESDVSEIVGDRERLEPYGGARAGGGEAEAPATEPSGGGGIAPAGQNLTNLGLF